MYLLIVDTTGIQPYIFGSNRLRENIGASYLAAAATGNWARELVRKVAPQNNLDPNGLGIDGTRRMGDHNLDAEVVYAGGGNFVTLFRTREHAKRFTGELSRKVLTDAPNLQLVIAQQELAWDANELSLRLAFEKAFKQLTIKKQARSLSAPLLGLGVTVMCQSTGLPAVGVTKRIDDDPGYPASSEIHAKLDVATKKAHQQYSEADQRLRRKIPPRGQYDYPRDFEYLGGTKGEHSYIAVVHADGDGMGDRIKQIRDEAIDNRELINNLRAFSQGVEDAAIAALETTLLGVTIQGGKIPHPSLRDLSVTLSQDSKTHERYLPFRPVVFGGDDVTFVCDGRLGLALATEYMRRFQSETAQRSACRGEITASAGVAIVKSHYPFARAYQLAEELARSAKRYRRKHNATGPCLDWHFALGGLSGNIDEIREREYTVDAGSLTLRPVTLAQNNDEKQRSWDVVLEGVKWFQGEEWAGRRNKVKALRDALREGPEAVKRFLAMFTIKNLQPILSGYTGFEQEGWHGRFCGYFDAIEIADWFIPLEGGKADATRATPATRQ